MLGLRADLVVLDADADVFMLLFARLCVIVFVFVFVFVSVFVNCVNVPKMCIQMLVVAVVVGEELNTVFRFDAHSSHAFAFVANGLCGGKNAAQMMCGWHLVVVVLLSVLMCIVCVGGN